MTSITDREGLHDAGTALYPVVPQAVHSRCTHCWQPGPSAMCADPFGEGLRRLCGPCAATMRTGWAVELTIDQQAEAWEWLARQHINHRGGEDTGVTDEHIDWALAALTPAWMPPQVGWERFECLCEDLLRHAEADAGEYDPASLEPDWRDAEAYANHCLGLVDDAVNKLIGRA
jgi:hypothetical protein